MIPSGIIVPIIFHFHQITEAKEFQLKSIID
jgi:hypothetical protein